MKHLVWLGLTLLPLRSYAEMPVVELPASDQSNPQLPLVVFLSGDGGWAAFDKGVTDRLRTAGFPVVGVNSLKYFWSRRTPGETATDLDSLVSHYTSFWQREHVVLVGFSQGADVLPFAVNRLPEATRARIGLLVLIGPGHTTSFKVKIGRWLGARPASDDPESKPEILQLSPLPILIVTGDLDPDAQNEWPEIEGLVHVRHPGDHHLDKDYDGIADLIMTHCHDRGAP